MRVLTGVVRAGAIEIENAPVLPEGARVTVYVEEEDTEPVALDEIAILTTPVPAPEPTVLVVEDDPDLGELFGEVIEAAGYRVEHARDGLEALQHLKESIHLPHLILLDMRMPNMDGEEFRRAQEADAEIADIPVVVTSADTNVVDTVANMNVGAFLPKPVNRSELVATISRLCEDDADDDSDAGKR
jgi:two-component system, chemotaxis family, chemotaxis protein CheY